MIAQPRRLDMLPAFDEETGLLNAVIDTPKGSRCKYKYKDGAFHLSKLLPRGMYFPYDFGFIPSTKGGDGDPLDVLVLSEEPSFAGCVLPVRLIGAIEAKQSEKGKTVRNDRFLGVIDTRQNPPELQALTDVHPQCLKEIEHFFVSYNAAAGKTFKPLRHIGAREALAKVRAAAKRGGE